LGRLTQYIQVQGQLTDLTFEPIDLFLTQGHLRKKWAQKAAKELRKAGFELEADRFAVGHREIHDQREAALERGDMEWAEHLNREPTTHRGPVIDAMERRGAETHRGREIREAEAAPSPKLDAPKPERSRNRVEADIRLALGWRENKSGWKGALEDWGYIVAEVRQQDIELAALQKAKQSGVWTLAEGGVENFTPEQMQKAHAAYDAWTKERQEKQQERKNKSPEGKEPFPFEEYVDYVQAKQLERFEELTAQAGNRLERSEALTEQAELKEGLDAEPPAPLVSPFAKSGDIVLANRRGETYILNHRAAGMDREEFDKYLAQIDRAALPDVLSAQAMMQERRKPEIEREQDWWQRIEEAIERGGGLEEFRQRAARSKLYGPDPVDHMREFRDEILGMRQELRYQLNDRSLSYEHRTALWEISSELRDLHRDTSKQIANLMLDQSSYEPGVIELGRRRLDEFAETLGDLGRSTVDFVGGLADKAGKMFDALVDFFITPSRPTPQLIAARREAQEKAVEAGFDAKRYKTDEAYRDMIDERDRIQREQDAQRRYYERQHDPERER
jgi:hypothetical protein